MTAARRAPRILVAPDKFKGTLTGEEAAAAITAGLRDVVPKAEIRSVVIADGGEGTVAAAVAAGAMPRVATVRGPLGAPVRARWARWGDVAIIELAASSGLQLVVPTARTALDAHTEGVGQVLRAALDDGAGAILIGAGGAASTDGGAGALRALGARLVDDLGREVTGGGGELERVAEADLARLDPRLSRTPITVLCDVETPLLGPNGAAALYGPQKGADADAVGRLERGLARLAGALRRAGGRDMGGIPWGGAAGGAAGGLHAALGAEFARGIDRVAGLIGLDELILWADLVVTGEGSFDAQSLQGKGPAGVIARARAAGRRVGLVAGRVALPEPDLVALGVAAWSAADRTAPEPGRAIGTDAALWVRRAAQAIPRALSVGGAPRAADARPS